MSLQIVLVSIWAGICSLDEWGPQFQIRKPLLAGTITGLLMGDLTQGLIIGGTLELMWLGVNNVGAYTPPDMIGGTVVGTYMGILTGGGVAAGIAFAVPVAVIMTQVQILVRTYTSVLVHYAERDAKTGSFDKANRWIYVSGCLVFLMRALPVFIAIGLGDAVLKDVMNYIPEFIMTGLQVSSTIIPAVGIAMLLKIMLKKGLWMYLLLGFLFAAYLNLGMLPISLIGIAFAGIADYIGTTKKHAVQAVATEEGDYDL